MPCKGIYDRKYAELYNDKTTGATTAKKLWLDLQASSPPCDCCTGGRDPQAAHDLQITADKPLYYEVFALEEIAIPTTTGTIRALSSGAPLGACQGVASVAGCHPYTCDACN